jgi:hypothetical protein
MEGAAEKIEAQPFGPLLAERLLRGYETGGQKPLNDRVFRKNNKKTFL